LVWLLAPTVVLAQQQHKYLGDQLPAYQSRLICGSDNVEHWSTPAIWNTVLRDVRIVVSTSRILLDALVHGFTRMARIALLVFDEAHHCMKSHDTNRIMQEFYHVESAPGHLAARPYILGLSASPITNAKPDALEKLERNLNSICKAPTRHLDELQRFVHQPQMCRLTYLDDPVSPSHALQKLAQLGRDYDISRDPYVIYLQRDGSRPQSREKLQKVLETGSTDSFKQLKALHRRTTELHQQLGEWASTYLLNACLGKMRQKAENCSNMVGSLEMEEDVFLFKLLSSVADERSKVPCHELEEAYFSPKATSLLRYLEAEYTESVTGIIFVKERSTAAILAHLISHHPLTHRYSAAPFVGSSNFARKESLADLADIKAQDAALKDFRTGKNNLLVCTSVMEEGVDISSMNLVIRFDEPANFRAFIQSRGRARMVESKFVLMCGENDPAGNYQKWKVLEAEMKAKYMDEMRQIAERIADEDLDEETSDECIAHIVTG
jgi:ERCC4-related helicase